MDQRNNDNEGRKHNENEGSHGQFPTASTTKQQMESPRIAHNHHPMFPSNPVGTAFQGFSAGSNQSSQQAAQTQALQGLFLGLQQQSQQLQQFPLASSSLQQLLQQQQQLQQLQSLQQLLFSSRSGGGSLDSPTGAVQADSSLQGESTSAPASSSATNIQLEQLIPLLLRNRDAANVAGSLPHLSAVLGSPILSSSLQGNVNSNAVLSLLSSQLSGSTDASAVAAAARKTSTGTSSSSSGDEEKKSKAPPFNVAAAYRQQQQLLELSSNESSSSSDPLLPHLQQQKQSSLESDGRHFLFPCRARAVPPDHNSKSAVLRIPPNVKHGQGLVCSHEGCQRKGIKFLYCSVCKTPVAKANFGNRHKHGNETTENVVSAVAAAPAPAGTGEGTRKRGRPPKVISIKQKQDGEAQPKRSKSSPSETQSLSQSDTTEAKIPTASEDDKFSLVASRTPLSSRPQDREMLRSKSSQRHLSLTNVDWDSLIAGQFQKLSSNERLELWRYMLENRPSSASSPSRTSNAATESIAAHSLSGTPSNPSTLREWLDRILWMSDPENWPQDATVASQASQRTIASSAASEGSGQNASGDGASPVYVLKDGESGDVEEQDDHKSNSNDSTTEGNDGVLGNQTGKGNEQ